MGNGDLRSLSEISEIDLESLSGKVVAVDAYNWLYKYLTITVQYTDRHEYMMDDGTDLSAVLGCLKGIPRFYEYNIVPVFVFDGAYHQLKSDEIADRKEQNEQAEAKYEEEKQAGNDILASKYESHSARLTTEMIESVKTILDVLELEYVDAPQAGESQAAYMTQNTSSVYGCASDDYDALLFGSTRTVRNITSPDDLEQISLEDTLQKLDLTREQLVDVALLCGTDYNDGVYGYGPKTAVKSVQNNEQEEIFEENDVDYTTLRDLFLNPEVTPVSDIPQNLSKPNTTELQQILVETYEFNEEEISSTIERIEDATEQPQLSKWT